MTHKILVHNTLSKKKEEFLPQVQGQVSMYVCGMTVYDHAHLGHARAYTSFDVMVRFFQYAGFKVKYIRNITDIDDKIIQRAMTEDPFYKNDPKESCFKHADKYTSSFHEDMNSLKLRPPTLEPKATLHVEDIIEMIQVLIDKGHAYEINGSVYFRVKSFSDYGSLSKREIDENLIKSRANDSLDKESPLDFALWKRHLEGEPFWESPFGKGRPGWHIECSAMSMKYLGAHFDIHGGGQDLVFPHHENEICQSEAYSGEKYVNYWVHNGFITVQKEKMSKSLKNFKTIKDLLKHYDSMQLKFYFLTTHYRSPLDFNDHLIKNAGEGLSRIKNTLSQLKNFIENEKLNVDMKKDHIPQDFIDSMCDDFNTPKAVSVIFSECTTANKLLSEQTVEHSSVKKSFAAIQQMLDVLGLDIHGEVIREVPKNKWREPGEDIFQILQNTPKKLTNEQVDALVAVRAQAKIKKNFDLADKIRNYLQKFGIEIRDQKETVFWKYV